MTNWTWFRLETGFIRFTSSHNKVQSLQITWIAYTCTWFRLGPISWLFLYLELFLVQLTGSSFMWNCHSLWIELSPQLGLWLSFSPELRWLQKSRKGSTHFHELFLLICALPWTCAATYRLPRNFHIGCPGNAHSHGFRNVTVYKYRKLFSAEWNVMNNEFGGGSR
jgi:hypothetical protein